MTQTFAKASEKSIPIHIIGPDGYEDWLTTQPSASAAWIKSAAFAPLRVVPLLVPDNAGRLSHVLVGQGSETHRKRTRFPHAALARQLPAGTYHLESAPDDFDRSEFALGWLFGSYSYDRYAKQKVSEAHLIAPDTTKATQLETIAAGEHLIRDLINTPASDMGPADLETAVRTLCQSHNADLTVIKGDDLLTDGFPMIHTVGRASATQPRLLDFNWGSNGPRLTLVGKGVCFDTGGLNIKPGGSMGLMKKDMGGAATVLGLAHMIMALKLPLQLRVLIPAVENAIDGSAFRPQDILTSRKGLTVEINNTDAEGRLVLADALALADEEPSDLIISMATLTGAARVAVGPELAPFYTEDDDLAQTISQSGANVQDPLWRMPFWDGYEQMIEPGIADLDNAPKGGFAGSITAALFLRRFVTETRRYVHFDIYGWNPSAKTHCPKGGVGQGARAVFEALPKLLDL